MVTYLIIFCCLTQFSAYWLGWLSVFILKGQVRVLIVGFRYDVSVMISWLFNCLQWLRFLIMGFGYNVSVDFIVIQLSQTAEPKDYIYSVA